MAYNGVRALLQRVAGGPQMTRPLRKRLAYVLAALTLLAATFAEIPSADAYRHRRRRVRTRYGYHAHVGAGGAVVLAPYGWYGGIGLSGTRILDQRGGPEQLDHGGGISLFGGIRVADRLSLELGWLGSLHNPHQAYTVYGPETDFLVLEAVTADAKVHLERSGNLDPFLQGGVGFYFLGRETLGLDSVGTGFQLGGGFDYYVAPRLALGLRVLYRGIAMGPPDGGEEDVFISAVNVEGSLGIHF